MDEVATKHRGGGAPLYRGRSWDMRGQTGCRQATPTDNRIMAKHNYEFLILEPGVISQGRGAERPKGMEEMETLQGDGAAKGVARQDCVDLGH